MENIGTKDLKGVKAACDFIKGIRWSEVWMCVFAFLFNRIGIDGGFYTIGISYFGSIFLTKQLRRWGFLFTVLGILSVGSLQFTTIKYLFIVLFIYGFQCCTSAFGKEPTLRSQSVAVGTSIFGVSLVIGVLNSLTFYSVFIYCLEAIVGASLVVMFYYGNTVIRENRHTPLAHKEIISMTLIAACITAGIVDFYIDLPAFGNIYFRDIVTFILLIAVTFLGGSTVGVTISMIISAVLVMIGYLPAHFVGVYGISVLVGGMFSLLGREGICFASGIGLLFGFAIFNEKQIDMQLLGAFLIGALVTLFIPKSYFGMCSWFGYDEEEKNEEAHLLRVQRIITEKLSRYAHAFSKLSVTFDKIADKKIELSKKDIQYIIEDTAEKVCQNCSMNTFCWKEYLIDSYEMAYKMLVSVEHSGQLHIGDIPEKFKSYCPNAEGFAYTLNFRHELTKQNLTWQNKFLESRQLVGEQLNAIASSIGTMTRDIEKELYFNKEDERNLTEALLAEGIKLKDIMVLENRGKKEEIDVYTRYCKKDSDLETRIKKCIEKQLNVKVDLEKHECDMENKSCWFKYKINKTYRIAAGAAFRAKNRVSGDVYSFMELDQGQYLLALADGMGSGKNALEESTATIELIESFIESGFEKSLTVKLINSVLVLKSSEENFSTIDITLIDEHSGVAEFLKIGAAASFILRGREVLSIKAETLPAGILSEVDMDIQKVQLEDGDIIIMVTDGMLESQDGFLEKEETFKHFILEADSDNPQYMADYLMKKVVGLLGESDSDDMTIVVAKMWKNF